MIKTNLDKLIEALVWIRDDARGFDLDYPVEITMSETRIKHLAFLYRKLEWFIGVEEEL